MRVLAIFSLIFCGTFTVMAQEAFEKDVMATSAGDLEITFIGHGTLMLQIGETVIHIDPWTRLADYAELPKADYVLITHHHGDHLDRDALDLVRTDNTVIVITELCQPNVDDGLVMHNGDAQVFDEFHVQAVPAYNLVHTRESGEVFHPKGQGNGYILTFGDTRVYIAGDTENTPEMKAFENIDVAFLPMNLPYTMTPEMVCDAAKAFRPKMLYPYHYGETDISQLVELLKDEQDIEVRIRNMQ
ncbi:MAG: MBL fold metallo-hydrolase [candidate division WOR-3 bacterium]|nr:MAG: MBL fold metallo-hydrolase [candidate division WOR-3 bacterium]